MGRAGGQRSRNFPPQNGWFVPIYVVFVAKRVIFVPKRAVSGTANKWNHVTVGGWGVVWSQHRWCLTQNRRFGSCVGIGLNPKLFYQQGSSSELVSKSVSSFNDSREETGREGRVPPKAMR